MSSLSKLNESLNTVRWALRIGFFRSASKLWNCAALHLVVDDSTHLMRFTLALPGLITLIVQVPQLPVWFGGITLAGGIGERAEYGIWHDFYETKWQWRKIIDRSGPGSGWEKRYPHPTPVPARVTSQESLVTALVDQEGRAWAATNHVDRWRMVLTTWHALGGHWWIPSLYDHVFKLYATDTRGHQSEAMIHVPLSPQMDAKVIFTELIHQIAL